MGSETRSEFHRDLDRLDIAIGSLIGLIPEAVQASTTALLVSDAEVAAGLQRWRSLVEDLYADVDHTVEVVVALQAPVAGDLRFLLACIRLVPTLHEVIDLVAAVASPSRLEIAEHLPPRAITLTDQLGRETMDVWSSIGQLWTERHAPQLRAVTEQVDAIADTRSTLAGELASGSVALPVALELAVVGHTFDRIARHARTAARLIDPLVNPGS